MTSKQTHKLTAEYFEKENYFGLNKNDVVFFKQGIMNCTDFNGNVLFEDEFNLQESPVSYLILGWQWGYLQSFESRRNFG